VTSNLLQGNLSGIIGLAFTAIASSGATPFWETLINNNQLSSPEMSFWLTRSTDTQTEVAGGEFTLGGTNSSLFTGDIEFIDMPVSTPSFWLLSLSGELEFAVFLLIATMLTSFRCLPSAVTVDGTSVAITTGTTALAAIDTGTTLIGGPTTDVAAIWAAVPGSQASQDSQGFFEFRASFPFLSFPLPTCHYLVHCLVDLHMTHYLACSTDVTISLSFGGKLWPISTLDMNLGKVSQGSTQCLGAIFDLSMGTTIPSGSGNPSWVVGDTFLVRFISPFSLFQSLFRIRKMSTLCSARAHPRSGLPSCPASQEDQVRDQHRPRVIVLLYSCLPCLL
jgi:cathepsin D